jgi:hypothetical protein
VDPGEDRVAAGLAIALRAPGERELRLRIEEVAVRRAAGAPAAVVVELLADEHAWTCIDAGALLHLDLGARGPCLGGELGGPDPVRIEAVLDGALAASLGDTGASAIAALLGAAHGDDPLLDQKSWWALSVTRPVELPPGATGKLWAGLRTVWRSDPPPIGMASVLMQACVDRGVAASAEPADGGDWIVRFERPGAIGMALLREATRQAIVYVVLPQLCPPERVGELARLVALVNLDLPIGCMEVDLASGQVRVRASVDVTGDSLTLAAADNLLGAAKHLAATWLPAVELVMGGAEAADAIAAP